MKYLATALLSVGLTSIALADEVRLTNGRTLVGIAHEESNRVLVETRLGDIGIPRSEVKEIVPGKTSIHDYQERMAALGPARRRPTCLRWRCGRRMKASSAT